MSTASADASGHPAAYPTGGLHLQTDVGDLTEGDLDQHVSSDTRALRESANRRAGDRELIEELRREEFTGRRYQAMEADLIRYGHGVLNGWLRTGYVFELAAKKGRAVRYQPREALLRDFLRESEFERSDLATDVVSTTIGPFRERALVQGGWTYEGGAALTTYFTTALVLEFVNVYRSWRSGHRHWLDAQDSEIARKGRPTPSDPADIVAHAAGVDALVRKMKMTARERAILGLVVDGYTHEEICEFTGDVSARAVEGVMHRLRVRAKEIL